MKNKYFAFGFDQGYKGSLSYFESNKVFKKEFPKASLSDACSWEDGWNEGNDKRHQDTLNYEMNKIMLHHGLTKHELEVLKQYFTQDVAAEIEEIKRCM